jgi:hypothetical protein
MTTEGLHVPVFMSRSRKRSEDNKLDILTSYCCAENISLKALYSYEPDVEVNESAKSGTIITSQDYIHEENMSGVIPGNPYCLSI